ncbi:MAG: redoxin domain-containing protein [Vicinamibacterales bacterium]
MSTSDPAARRGARWWRAVSTAVACAAALGVATSVAAQPFAAAVVGLQEAVDTLDVVDLDGRRWTAADLRGRVTLIDFWASWCAPCLEELPGIERLRARYGRDRFEVLGVSLDAGSRRDFVAWRNRLRIWWPQVHDGRAFSGPVARQFGVIALPASVLVDPAGRVAAVNLRGAGLEAGVATLVEQARLAPR